ncbi:MAG: 5'/3'-nucleotidase SurE [Pseudomonadales bacterium]|jgi:5'-nucleotidase
MRILITNDDGIQSPGIQELARHIESAGYEVVVVAPDHDASGTGTSLGRISSEEPVNVSRHSIPGLRAEAYGISGSPALCVVTGYLEAFGPVPDVVVSGINAGLNTGRSTLHSGTVGAALAAQNFGIHGIAVSLDGSTEWQWETAAKITVEILPSVTVGPTRSAFNVNVPGLPRQDVIGIRWAGLAKLGSVRSAITSVGVDQLDFHLVETGYLPDETTDLGTVRAGYASITSLHGAVEVWNANVEAGKKFESSCVLPGASAGDTLSPARSVLEDS